ncbi:MAG TPA: porin [Steroidobacteraceae bacterium]|jgi:phosphate-selective porin OprO/OprP|nr:porin [Steroidobacteraceae bacterium]
MNILIKSGVVAALAGASVGLARADVVTTTGGIKVVSSNGDFSAAVGTLLQFDAYEDQNDSSSGIGSGIANGSSNNAFRFRRAWITLAGKVYSFNYHVDYDTVTGALARAWLEHGLLPNGSLFIGQDKPWGSLDELARNPDTPFMERNIVSASGVNAAATYSDGVFYEWSHQALTDNDSLWLGASAVSLHKQTGSTDTSTQGSAYNARIGYAPIIEKDAWAHVGASIIDATGATGSSTAGTDALKASYAYGDYFDSNEKLTLANYPVSSTGARPHSRSISGELAGAYGPAYLQAEYDDVAFHETGEANNTVRAYSATAAYTLTGETRSYNAKDSTYGTITPAHSYGAWEVAVRYDQATNDGSNGIYTGLALAGAKAALATADKVTLITVGLNYYPNDHIRFVLNYEHGKANLGREGSDSPNTIGARAQLWF